MVEIVREHDGLIDYPPVELQRAKLAAGEHSHCRGLGSRGHVIPCEASRCIPARGYQGTPSVGYALATAASPHPLEQRTWRSF